MGQRKHEYDMNYFEEIDSIPKAYFLGWMFTDGNIKGLDSARIQVQEKDRDVLDLFLEEINGTTKMIKYEKGKEQYPILWMNSRKLVSDLVSLGCIPRKTFVVKPPNIPKKFQKPFWRGCWEADGSLIISDQRKKRNGYRAIIAYNGTKEMCIGFQNYMGWDTKIFPSNRGQKSKIKTQRTAKSISFVKKSLKEFEKIYDDTDFFLKRKKNLFDFFLREREFYEKEQYYLVEGR